MKQFPVTTRHIFLIFGLLYFVGCAPTSTVVYRSDENGRWTKTVYSKSYISDKVELAEGLQVVVTGFDEGRVNPIAAAIGALGPETVTPPASFVAHFRNISSEEIIVEPRSLSVAGKT